MTSTSRKRVAGAEALNSLTSEILDDEVLTKIALETALTVLTDLQSIDDIAPTVRYSVQRHAAWMLADTE